MDILGCCAAPRKKPGTKNHCNRKKFEKNMARRNTGNKERETGPEGTTTVSDSCAAAETETTGVTALLLAETGRQPRSTGKPGENIGTHKEHSKDTATGAQGNGKRRGGKKGGNRLCRRGQGKTLSRREKWANPLSFY